MDNFISQFVRECLYVCVYVSEFAYDGILRGFGDVSAIGRVSMSRRGYHCVVCEVG